MKRIKLFITALVLSLSSVFALVAPQALAASITWEGDVSSDASDGDNWTGGSAPGSGDTAVFPTGVTNRTVTIDSSTAWAAISFTGAAASASSYTIEGTGPLTLTGGVTNSMTGSTGNIYHTIEVPVVLGAAQAFTATAGNLAFDGTVNLGSYALTATGAASISLNGVVSGSGSILKTGAGGLYLYEDNTYTGATTVNAGRLSTGNINSLGTTAGATTVGDGADLALCIDNGDTSAENITLTGESSDPDSRAKLSVYPCGGGGAGGADETYGYTSWTGTATLSGDIILGSDITLVPGLKTIKFTGALSGNYTISLFAGYEGKLVVESSPNTSKMTNGTHEAPVLEKTLSDSQPTNSVAIFGHTVVVLDGERGDITVGSGATLKGGGTAGAVSLLSGATIAPGHSPGCLNTGNLLLDAGSTYEFELGGKTACDEYDQIKVTGTVDVTGSTLSISRVDDFVPTAGQKFVIISNDGTDAITGTFDGLDQAATFEVNGVTYSISYVGGDGNDIELTVTAVSPDTGFALLTNNPFITVALMLGAAGGIAIMARRQLGFAFRKR